MRASYAAGRTTAVCGFCRRRYASTDGWAWACSDCTADAQADSLAAVTQLVLNAVTPTVECDLCPVDGCLLLPGEPCPACRVRERAKAALRSYTYSDTEDDPKRPVAWRPNGRGIQVPVYESEVA